MKIRILGSAAGGGFPQWNCACPGCSGLRDGSRRALPRSQSQLAVSSDDDGQRWVLLNASPDLRSQLEASPALRARSGTGTPRHSPVRSVILTNADLDHVLGLLLLRESQKLRIYATEAVQRILREDNSFFQMLFQYPGQTEWETITPLVPFSIRDEQGADSGLRCEAIPLLPGRFPIYVSPTRAAGLDPLQAVQGLMITGRGGRSLAYVPGLPELGPEWLARLGASELVFCDGTFWSDGELPALLGKGRTAREMGHIPVSGPLGSLELLAPLKRPRKVYIHINNTNPMLGEDSPERREVEKAGLEVGADGMEFEL